MFSISVVRIIFFAKKIIPLRVYFVQPFSALSDKKMNKIFRTDINPLAKLVYLYLHDRIGASGEVTVGHAEIAEHTGLSISSVKKYLAELESAELIRIHRQYNPETKSYLTNRYELLNDSVAERPSRETSRKDFKNIKPDKKLEEDRCTIKLFCMQNEIDANDFQIAIWRRYGSDRDIIEAIRKAQQYNIDSIGGYVTSILKNPTKACTRVKTIIPSPKKQKTPDNGVAAYIDRLKRAGL